MVFINKNKFSKGLYKSNATTCEKCKLNCAKCSTSQDCSLCNKNLVLELNECKESC